jgi:hypothetical protein
MGDLSKGKISICIISYWYFKSKIIIEGKIIFIFISIIKRFLILSIKFRVEIYEYHKA